MRTFRCTSCEHTWQLPFGLGGVGSQLSCPECGSENVHRVHDNRGWRRRGWGAAFAQDDIGIPYRGGRRRGRRWFS